LAIAICLCQFYCPFLLSYLENGLSWRSGFGWVELLNPSSSIWCKRS
jgi:hypothetical protein